MATIKSGSKGPDVARLQKGLLQLGYHPGPLDGIYGSSVRDAVEDFQEAHDLLADGIVGRGTLSVYNPLVPADCQILVAAAAEPADAGARLPWDTTTCDKHKSGFDDTTLRQDVARAFEAMRAEVNAKGAIVTSAGGKRGLSSGGGSAQSKTSLHYIGRAHDLALSSGMQNPLSDPYVICKRTPGNAADRKWIVWARATDASVPVVTLQGIKCRSMRNAKNVMVTVLDTVAVTGRFVNLTEIMAKHGFQPISGRRKFFTGGSYTSAEWWHFQWEQGLAPGQSTFGAELLRVYSPQEARTFKFWAESMDAVWGDDFN